MEVLVVLGEVHLSYRSILFADHHCGLDWGTSGGGGHDQGAGPAHLGQFVGCQAGKIQKGGHVILPTIKNPSVTC